MDIGEGVAAPLGAADDGKCVLCGVKHDKPKKLEIKPVAAAKKQGWKRTEKMSNKFEAGNTTKTSIYPGSAYPPPYKTEGHHCLAFESFVLGGSSETPRDAFPVLNHLLDEGGYFPNRDQNCIHLPGRPKYLAFWQSVDENKPLQMHIGNHDDEFFLSSRSLVEDLRCAIDDPDICEELSIEEIKEDLLRNVAHAENFAFVMIAKNASGWKCHPLHEPYAIRLYNMSPTESLRVPTGDRLNGYGGVNDISNGLEWPVLDLETGVFG